jgi:ankyrin repeat protein
MDIQTAEGWTPLHLAARERNVEAAARLLDLGCEGALTDAEGCTPLHLAARQADLYMFSTLHGHPSCVSHTTDMRGGIGIHFH